MEHYIVIGLCYNKNPTFDRFSPSPSPTIYRLLRLSNRKIHNISRADFITFLLNNSGVVKNAFIRKKGNGHDIIHAPTSWICESRNRIRDYPIAVKRDSCDEYSIVAHSLVVVGKCTLDEVVCFILSDINAKLYYVSVGELNAIYDLIKIANCFRNDTERLKYHIFPSDITYEKLIQPSVIDKYKEENVTDKQIKNAFLMAGILDTEYTRSNAVVLDIPVNAPMTIADEVRLEYDSCELPF